MSEELIRNFVSDLNTHEVARLEPWFTAETTLWIPPRETITGGRRILALFRAVFRLYDELQWEVVEVCPVGGGRFFYRTDSWGTLRGAPYKNSIVTDIRFDAEGRIVFLSDYFKDTSFGRTS